MLTHLGAPSLDEVRQAPGAVTLQIWELMSSDAELKMKSVLALEEIVQVSDSVRLF